MSKTLIHTDSKYHGKKLTIPYDGTIQLGPTGEVTVSDQAAEVLLTIPFWEDPEAVEEEEAEAEPEIPKKKAKKAKLQMETVSTESAIGEINLDDLDKLEPAELLEIAAAAGIDVPAAMQAKKNSLVTYVRTQLKKKL